jgi:hypothetical protein
MKTLFFLAALAVVGLVVTGAIKMQKSSESTYTIQIDEQRVKQEASQVVGEGKHVLEEAESAFNSSSSNPQK